MVDCYDGEMDLSIPILICEENEELRLLLREMLTKHGFFHLVEASNSTEAYHAIRSAQGKKQFILTDRKILSPEIKEALANKKEFLIFSQPDANETLSIASRYGVNHVISFPYTSKSLVEKILGILNQ